MNLPVAARSRFGMPFARLSRRAHLLIPPRSVSVSSSRAARRSTSVTYVCALWRTFNTRNTPETRIQLCRERNSNGGSSENQIVDEGKPYCGVLLGVRWEISMVVHGRNPRPLRVVDQ